MVFFIFLSIFFVVNDMQASNFGLTIQIPTQILPVGYSLSFSPKTPKIEELTLAEIKQRSLSPSESVVKSPHSMTTLSILQLQQAKALELQKEQEERIKHQQLLAERQRVREEQQREVARIAQMMSSLCKSKPTSASEQQPGTDLPFASLHSGLSSRLRRSGNCNDLSSLPESSLPVLKFSASEPVRGFVYDDNDTETDFVPRSPKPRKIIKHFQY